MAITIYSLEVCTPGPRSSTRKEPMRPEIWQPPIALSTQEEQIVTHIRRAKLFVFLRKHRHMLFNEAFQQELASLYDDSVRGRPPISPALVALATILQAYMGVSDDEVRDRHPHGSAVATCA